MDIYGMVTIIMRTIMVQGTRMWNMSRKVFPKKNPKQDKIGTKKMLIFVLLTPMALKYHDSR